MPDITTTGNVTAKTVGCEFLGYKTQKIGLLFSASASGSVLPTTLQVGTLNDIDVFVPFDNGTVIALPTTIIINAVNEKGVVINVSGGSPNFNVSNAGAAGVLGP